MPLHRRQPLQNAGYELDVLLMMTDDGTAFAQL